MRRYVILLLVAVTASALIVPLAAYAAAKPTIPPVVTALSAYNGPPGTTVTITGTGFGPKRRNSIVWFAGVQAPQVSWTDTVIVFTVPSGVGAGYVGVQCDAGMSNGKYFVPFDAPVVTSVSAVEQAVGADITITGTSFDTSQGVGWVSFNGTPGIVKSWSPTAIVVTVPSGATAGYVGVVQHELSSNGTYFTPYAQGFVTGISATSALVGGTITLTGTGFGSTPGSVVVNGTQFAAATWSDTSVTFTVPDSVTSGYAGVIAAGGRVSNGKWLTVAPRVDALSNWWAAPGTQLTVTGAGFGAAQGSPYVLLLGGVEVPASLWSNTSVTFTVPLTGASGYVGFTTADRSATSNGIWALVQAASVITTVSPSDTTTGAVLTISGTGFGAGGASSTVQIGTTVLSVSTWTDTQIVAKAPDVPCYGYLGVWNNGVASNGVLVNVGAAPVVSIAAGVPATIMQARYGTPAQRRTSSGRTHRRIRKPMKAKGLARR